MTGRFPYRVFIPVPQASIDDANQLALCLGAVPADGQTFGHDWAQDAAGNLYSWAAPVVTSEWLAALSAPIVAPSFAPDADLAAASRAAALLEIHPIAAAVPAAPDRVCAILSANVPNYLAANLAAAGLTPAQI